MAVRSQSGQITGWTDYRVEILQGRQIGKLKYKFADILDITTVDREVTNGRTDHRVDISESRQFRVRTYYRTDRAERFQGIQTGRRNYRFVGIANIARVGREAVTNSRTNHRADRSEGE